MKLQQYLLPVEHRFLRYLRKVDIDKRLEELQAELLKLASSITDYEDVTEEIYRPNMTSRLSGG